MPPPTHIAVYSGKVLYKSSRQCVIYKWTQELSKMSQVSGKYLQIVCLCAGYLCVDMGHGAGGGAGFTSIALVSYHATVQVQGFMIVTIELISSPLLLSCQSLINQFSVSTVDLFKI